MRTIIISVFAILLFACGKEEFDSYLIPQGTEDIIKVALYPNSPVLIADGKAQLTFKVQAFIEIQSRTSITYNENGVTMVRDSFFLDTTTLITDRIPEDRISITTGNGEKINGKTFSTTSDASEITFTCQIGKIKSKPCTVKLIKPEIPEWTPIKVPVVFHLLYNTTTKSIAEGVNEKYVTEVLDRLNKVFAGTFAPAPSYLDTKITFVPAATDANGMPLAEKGINRVDLKAAKVGAYEESDYILDNLVWNPDGFLNIWLYETWNSSSERPMYILDNGEEIEGLDLTPVHDISEAEISYPEDAGIIIPITSVFSIKDGTSDIRYEFLFGKFFGLYGTDEEDGYEGEDSDYCTDTYVSLYGPIGIAKRTAIPAGSEEEPIYYDSFNIMDSYSASTTVSYEQALRIRKVIENCPLRMIRE